MEKNSIVNSVVRAARRRVPWYCLILVLAVSFPMAAAAQNATQQTTNDIVRTTSQSLTSLVCGRIEFVNAPTPQSQTLPGSQDGNSPGIPVPGKDRAALSPAPGWAGNTMLALAAAGEQTGLSAGDAYDRRRSGVWGMTGVNWLGSTQSGASFDGNLVTAMVGYDYRILDPLVAGLALGYQWVDLTTHYNQGFIKSGGLTVMPYLSYAITPNLVADASFGLGFNNYNTSRISCSPCSQAQEVSGHYNSLRTIGAANVTYYHLAGNWTLSGKVGTILANEYQYYYVENNSTRHYGTNTFLGELIVGGKASYRYKIFEPHLGINYLYDYALEGGGDRDEVQGVIGFGLRPTERLLFNVECSNSFFREYTRNTSLTGSLRFEF